MNIMEHLEASLGSIVIPDLGKGGATELFCQIELEIREGIAQELEQLVLKGEPTRVHGIPLTVWARSGSEAVQNVMRGAANVVRGKDPATEDDWGRQTERMQAMAELRDLQKADREMFPMPSDADLQRKFDDAQDRMREWND